MRSLNHRRPNLSARRKSFQPNSTRLLLSALTALSLVAGYYFAPALLSRRQTPSSSVAATAAALPLASDSTGAQPVINQAATGENDETPNAQVVDSRVRAAYGRLPIAFEENAGQHDERVKYSARGNGFQLFLASDEAVLALNKPLTEEKRDEHDARAAQEAAEPRGATGNDAVLRMKLVGANRRARMTGEDELAAKSNYFVGAGPESWHPNVAMFEKIRYAEVYPGVDVVYYGNQRQLEYDFILAPQVDPARIKFKFSGAREMHLDAEGHLLLQTDSGHVRQEKPLIYQSVDGRRQRIEGSYAINNHGEIGFQIGQYDRSQPLVIDPVLSYSTYLGGAGTDQALAIARDEQGNAYITGQTTSANFPTTLNPFQSTIGDNVATDAFVLKLNASGTSLVYATYLGGNGSDSGTGIAVDMAGNAYITGLTASGSFPRTFGTLQESKRGGVDGFVTKLNAAGNGLVYSSFLGGENFDQGYAIAVNGAGHAYVTGRTDSTTFLGGIPMPKQGSSAYKSSDAAGSWNASNNGLTDANVASITVDPTNHNTVYAAGQSGVFKSTDAGNFWRLTGQSRAFPAPLTANNVVVDPSAPATLYAGTNSGVYKSSTGGDLWDTSSVGLSGLSSFVFSLTLDPANPSTLYAGTFDGVFKSVNGGANWSRSSGGIPTSANLINEIIFDPTDSKIIYVATARGVYKSLNSASSWAAVNNGLVSTGGAIPSVSSLAVSPASPATIYAGTTSGMFKTTDGGLNWVSINDGLRVPVPGSGLFIPSISAVVVSPTDAATLYASSTQGGIFKSTDGGANWVFSSNGLDNFFITGLAIDPATPSNVYASTSSGADAFVIKINAVGSHFDYLQYLGGNENDLARGIAVDPDGNAYVTGSTNSFDFPTLNPLQQSGGGFVSDAFVTKLATDGATVYSTYLGGTGSDLGFGIAVSAAGNAYVTGSTTSTNFPTAGRPTSNTFSAEAFVSKLSVSGSNLEYSIYHGGFSNDQGFGIALDAAGNAYVTGSTSSSNFPVVNGVQAAFGGGTDAFVFKLNPVSDVVYSTYLGGAGSDQGNGIAADNSGAAYLAGSTGSFDFPTSSPLQPTQAGSSGDAFIAKIVSSVELSLTMTDAPDPVVLGGNITYTINVANVGELPATGVRLTDTLPAGAVLVSATAGTGTCSGTNPLVCELGNFASGASATVTIVITPPAVRTVTNTVSVAANESEVNIVNNTATQQTLVDFADLSLTAAALESSVPGGGQVTYVLSVNNNGVTAPNNVNVNIALPSTLTLVSCSVPGGGGLCSGPANNLTVAFPSLAVNASQSIVVVASVNGGVANGTMPTVTANVSSSLPDPDPSNNSAQASATVALPAVQPKSNGKIAFTSDGLYVMNDDGTNITKIYSEPQGRFSLATWSPDGTKIAFMNEVSGSSFTIFEVRVVNADGSEPRVLSTNGTLDSRPTWSPSGAFIGYVERNRQSIQIVNVTGKPAATTLFTTSSILAEVSWSPDGTKLLYNVNHSELWTANIDGSNQKLIETDPSTIDSEPVWSPDGTKILFTRRLLSSSSDSRSIYTMNADGTNAQPLPNPVLGTSSLQRPVFSPDGTKIAYENLVSINGSSFLTSGILKVNADGTNITRVPADGQAGRAPSWQALPATGPPPTPEPSFKISGRVTPPSGESVLTSGFVRLDVTGSRTVTTYPDSNGNYSFTLPAGGNYTITPAANPFYTFTPASYTFNNLSADQPAANFTTTRIIISISGRVTDSSGAPMSNVEIVLNREGFIQSTAYTAADGRYTFNNLSYGRSHTVYVSQSSRANYDFTPDARAFFLTQSEVADFVGTPKNSFQFSTEMYLVGEGAGRVPIVVTRAGIPATIASPASVTIQTFDDPAAVPCDPTLRRPDGTLYPQGTAYARCDYATTVETLTFAPGETQRIVNIPIIDDVHVEGTEFFQIRLSNATGATLGFLNSAHVNLQDNDSGTAVNPTRTTSFFVRQHYLDFLSREPEPNEPWSAILNNCPNPFNLDPASLSAACDRIIVSQSFFGAPEFRLKGLYTYTFYRVAFDRRPEYAEIIPDMSALSGATAAEVFARRAALPVSFTARQEFKTRYDALTDSAFVNALLDRYSLLHITTRDPQQPENGAKMQLTRADLVARLGAATGTAGALTRAQVLRAIVESDEVGAVEYKGAFVAMQYYGYLRRTPEESGYQAWLRVITEDPNNVRLMVNGFLNSTEYRLRFGQP